MSTAPLDAALVWGQSPAVTPRDLRTRCSQHFTFADLIECGETWRTYHRAGASIANLPLRDETFEGIAVLAREILDPLQEKFGQVVLTYGFAGPALTKHIKGQISPPHDQHAGSEHSSRNALICARRGQSCDLSVPKADSLEVGRWIKDHLPFDRMYLYGAGRPLHVSYGPESARKIYAMTRTKVAKVPRDVSRRDWDEVQNLLGDP